MDPPAPVTRTRLPAMCSRTEATSVAAAGRPSRSLMRGSRTPSIRAPPVSSSLTDGITFGTSPHRSAASVRSWMTLPLRPAIAMTRTLAPVPAATSAIWPRPPSTGTPSIRSRLFAGSSSRIATGR